MDWITNSKLFKGSKYQNKILAAIQDPINKPLVRQVTSYLDEKYVEDSDSNLESNKPEVPEESSSSKPKPASHASGGGHFSAPSGANGHFDMPEDAEFDEPDMGDAENLDIDENPEEPSEPEPSNSEEIEQSKILDSDRVQASTYVTVSTVSQAVTEIPGILNSREDTCGVTYAAIKSGTNNEIWIYYDSNVDINKVLEKVNYIIANSGYYFLEFNRVSRDENAIVFTINWISSYFKPLMYKDEADEG